MSEQRTGTSILGRTFAILLCAALLVSAISGQSCAAEPVRALRLYVFDCGRLHFDNADAYALKKAEVANLDMSVPAFLVVHPKGTLLFEAGIIPDTAFTDGARTITAGIATSSTPLLPQLAAVGYTPTDITFVAFSHYHSDHIANANAFAGSTWLARRADRDMMFADPPRVRNGAANFARLKESRTILLESEDHDVFGDGSVVLKSAPGHTPGHQVLFLKLAQTGPIVLGGDLYHYPEERTLHRLPPREFSVEQTAASRAAVEAFLQKTGAQLWIEHDLAANVKLRKAPAYYE